jgi:hypothetical protein
MIGFLLCLFIGRGHDAREESSSYHSQDDLCVFLLGYGAFEALIIGEEFHLGALERISQH